MSRRKRQKRRRKQKEATEMAQYTNQKPKPGLYTAPKSNVSPLNGHGTQDNANPAKSTTYQSSYLNCHNGPLRVMTIGDCLIWAGSHREVKNDWDWTLMLRLSDRDFFGHVPVSVELNDQAQKSFPELMRVPHTPAIIDVNWGDFHVPDLDAAWWKALHQAILKCPPKSNMVVHCIGGHGRTGTALAILAALAGKHKENGQDCPVEYIRKAYCESAVESESQINYITKMTGVPITKARGSFALRMYQGFGGNQDYAGTAFQSASEIPKGAGTYSYINGMWQRTDVLGDYGKEDFPYDIDVEWEDKGVKYVWANDKVWEVLSDHSYLEVNIDDGSYGGSTHRLPVTY